jgi:CHAT domain-containing protein
MKSPTLRLFRWLLWATLVPAMVGAPSVDSPAVLPVASAAAAAADRQSEALNNLGLTDLGLGQYESAITRFQQVFAQRKGDPVGASAALYHLGVANQQLRRYPQALALFEQALALRPMGTDPERRGEALTRIGDLHQRLGQPQRALDALQPALEIAQSLGQKAEEGDILRLMAMGYQDLGKAEDLKSTANQRALDLYQQALSLQRAAGNRPYERRVLSQLGNFYKQHNQNLLSILYFKQSVNLSEQLRQAPQLALPNQPDFYSQTVAKDYRVVADLLLLEGRILEAQQILELLKAQEIREFSRDPQLNRARTTRDAQPGTPSGVEELIVKEHGTLIAFGQKVYDCKRSACPQLSALNDQLQALTQQYNQTLQTYSQSIRDRRAQDDAFLDPNRFLPKARAIAEAQPHTVLIYPLVMKDKLWLVWAAKGGVIKSTRLPVSQQQIGEVVLKFRQQLQSPISSPKELKATGKILYDWLIKPLEGELQANQIQNLVFAPDRVTRYIPMAALYDGKQYLVETYSLSTILSADLTDLRDRSPLNTPETAILALGVSDAVNNFAPLPNVPAELDAIVRSAGRPPQEPRQAGVYPGLKFLNQRFDFRALRDNLVGHKIVHIATHGHFVAGRPADSFLVLGNGASLTIPEIATLQDLSDVQLVVLSACETALGGPDAEGTEVSGISAYFLRTGAKSVMASLWTVDDSSTSQLMQSFYSHLASPKLTATKAAALRQAQLQLLYGQSQGQPQVKTPDQSAGVPIGEFSHPYFWAPFVLTGNGF